MFGCCVSGLPFKALDPAPEEVFTDGTASFLEHQWDLVLHAQEHAPEIDPHDTIPLVLREIGSRFNWLFNTGIIECEIEASEHLTVLPMAVFTSSARETSHLTGNVRTPSSSII